MNFGIFLKNKRLERNLTLRQMAYKTGFSHTYISDIEKEVAAKPETIEKIAEVLELTEEEKEYLLKEIIYFKTPNAVLEELEGLKYQLLKAQGLRCNMTGEKIETNIDVSTGFKDIPIFPSISAGFGLEEAQTGDVEFITVPKTRMFQGDVIGVRVNGDSMEYTIENGVVAFIKRGVEVPNKKIGAFILDNRPLLKRMICIDGECFLRSDNREYPDIQISNDSKLEVVGRYIGSIDPNAE